MATTMLARDDTSVLTPRKGKNLDSIMEHSELGAPSAIEDSNNPIVTALRGMNTHEQQLSYLVGLVGYALSPSDAGYVQGKIRETVAEIAMKDEVTGAWNRAYFNNRLEEEVKRTRRNSERFGVQENQSLTLYMIDIDNMKNINDTYGHLAGDAVLRRVAELAVGNIRGGIVCRYGGDEDAVIAPETTVGDARIAAERLLKSVREDELLDKYGARISIGWANYTEHVKDPNERIEGKTAFQRNLNGVVAELVQKGDDALYEAKNSGRDKAVMWDATIQLRT